MNLQHLRHFVAIAEEGHFGRAALRLHMAQPPLSQSLARLEASLGFRLVDRTRRSVALTPAGQVFLREVRPAILQIDCAARLAGKASGGILDRIEVGFVSSALGDVIPRAVRELAIVEPDAHVGLQEMSTDQQLDLLRHGRLDVGFIYSSVRRETDVDTCLVRRSKPMAAIPAGWPLARRRRLTLSDLADMPLIVVPQSERPKMRAALAAACERCGIVPRIAQEIVSGHTTISLVGAGIGMAFANDAMAQQGHRGVAFRPIDGLPPEFALELSMAWLARFASPRHEAAVGALRRAFAKDATQPAE